MIKENQFFLQSQYIINDKLNSDDLNDETNLFLTLMNKIIRDYDSINEQTRFNLFKING